MNKNLVKIASILMIIAVLLTVITPIVFADWTGLDPTTVGSTDTTGQTAVKDIGGKIIGFIRNTAVAVAVIMNSIRFIINV